MMLGQRQWLQPAVSLTVTRVSKVHRPSFPSWIAICVFRFQYSVEYVTRISFSTLHYKVGFVCSDFAQLWADVGVLSTFKIGGEVKL